MKALHRGDLFCWSSFDEVRNVDFNGYAWIRPEGNVLVDPMPMSPHDLAHLRSMGGAAWIVITNVDHVRDAQALVSEFGARLAGPVKERDSIGLQCDRWLSDGEELVPGLRAIELEGSKTLGELALHLSPETLITGDLVRAHQGGSLMLLPDAKLRDKGRAIASVERLAAIEGIEAVLVGDGWPAFRDGGKLLRDLVRAARS